MKIRCLKCNDVIESLNKHDCKWCKYKTCTIDGGKDYTRILGDPNLMH